MMHRFFVPAQWIQDGSAHLSGSVARQVSRVLRLAPGQRIVLLDNSGAEYVTRLLKVAPDLAEGEVESVQEGTGEPRVRLTLYQAMLKGDKFEWKR